MDLLAHAMYGATVCSRSGLAGGRSGAGVPVWRDRTVRWALCFGILPDILSMWIPFAVHAASGAGGNFFQQFGGGWLVVYRAVHSLVPAGLIAAASWRWRRELFVPSLAWGLHVLLDAVSHGAGKFQTLVFYPLSSWGIDGIAWWRTGWFFWSYWTVLVAAWPVLWLVRRRTRAPWS